MNKKIYYLETKVVTLGLVLCHASEHQAIEQETKTL